MTDAENLRLQQMLLIAAGDNVDLQDENAKLWAIVENIASFPRMRLTTSQGEEIDGTVTNLDLAVDAARALLAKRRGRS